ncbi:cobyrinic acid a [Sporomusaceae bacterium BoRhaA]|uniref:cobyrinate a,c-diamide synthase n=1 Tax=Pelorhabdus rhamnosifermentans TaxID=2772457 RepID=UPI001C0624E4|nr:cobyrinate a,c-diamide synthase [Pelorhabdus rhamnosifermentans]MBU2703013.1 cobyrinic acid a [Pelorhabdus rhamnosifermentans]
MNKVTIPRIVIAGTQSGVGKTTIVTGLLAALKQQGLKVQSYKVGPDYIDPGYHALASGQAAHNLDTWLIPPEKIQSVFIQTARGNDIALIEGVMGLYDGGKNGISSTAAIAKLLDAPVILVIDAKSMGESAAALVLGFKQYDPELKLAGVIVNRLGSDSHGMIVEEALNRIGVPVLGKIRRSDELVTPERHLGLTPTSETDSIAIVEKMGFHMRRQIELPKISAIARSAAPLWYETPNKNIDKARTRIGIAFDEAFSFYYPASLAVLERLGAELVYFSPLRDRSLPLVDGLFFGGGFPEMFVRELAENQTMLQQISDAGRQGMPIVAECGGFMYLTREMVDFSGQSFPLVGLIPGVCAMERKLQTVGYVEATAKSDNVVCARGQTLRGHEFHFSTFIPDAAYDKYWAFQFKKMRTGKCYNGGFVCGNTVASYLHMHFLGCPTAAQRFVDRCATFCVSRGV